jgi:hypothetical protein
VRASRFVSATAALVLAFPALAAAQSAPADEPVAPEPIADYFDANRRVQVGVAYFF